MASTEYRIDYDELDFVSKLAETPILLDKKQRLLANSYIKKPYLKKWKKKDMKSLLGFSIERVILTLKQMLDEKDLITQEGKRVSDEVEKYMMKNKLESFLLDSKEHGRVLVRFKRGRYERHPITYRSYPGKNKVINGKEYYILTDDLPDKVGTAPIIEELISRKDVWTNFFKKYIGLKKNIYFFLGIETPNGCDHPPEAMGPVVLGGLGEGLIITPSKRAYAEPRIIRTKDVTIKL